jgi:class 3 adenylate cyclase
VRGDRRQDRRDRGHDRRPDRRHDRASEVRISQTVKDLVAGSGLAFEDAGEHELKGVPDRWRLYRVVSAA